VIPQSTCRRTHLLAITLIVLFNLQGKPLAEDPPARVLATVDGVDITTADVDREIAIAFPNRTIEPGAREALQKQTADQLIRRELVLRYLRETRQAASPMDVDLAFERLKKQLDEREESLENYLRSKKLDENSLRRMLVWQIGWGRFLEKYLTDENLQSYFDKHRREFDGSVIHVAHILFPVNATGDLKDRIAVQQRASDVLNELRSKKIEFAEAAQRYSSGPSRDMGGDIGWINRREPMPEAFSKAAFALEPGQISEPIETPFGLHLIRCLEIKQGSKNWSDVRAELEPAVTEYLFNWAAEQVRSKAKIERE
jgi:peptidyl-prolyl cis-trans isomerase C